MAPDLTRREFLNAAGTAALAKGAGPDCAAPEPAVRPGRRLRVWRPELLRARRLSHARQRWSGATGAEVHERYAAARIGDGKYVKDGTTEGLFDLTVDPGEKNDLRASRPAEFARLTAAYAPWHTQMLPRLPASA